MSNKKNYFSNKNILITGITGFVGSHLAKKLSILDANVFGLSKRATGKQMVKASILDYSIIDGVIKNNNITICFHLAGEALVEEGQKDPYHTFKVNIEGTLNILECSRINKLEKVIIASTSHVYGNNKVPYLEKYIPKPSRPYETSKTCTDLIAQSYADTFNLPVLIPRFVNIFGPGDLNFTRLIPRTMRNIIQKENPTMWSGVAVRDYLYIDDAISAYTKLAESDINKIDGNRIFNFGGDNIISAKDLIEKILFISGEMITIQRIEKERESEIKTKYVSWKKAKKILHWSSQVPLNTGLQLTYNWYKEHASEFFR